MNETFAYTLKTDKTMDSVLAAIEKLVPEHNFRILHIHDVQATLAEKGFQRDPLKIVEVCNSKFAHEALKKEMDVALFMPCRITVYTEGTKTVVSLGRPTMIGQMMPKAGLESLAAEVEATLIKVMKAAV
ncbi:MAG: DUF302 domain-containing protein [Candidatus Zixiibacteriota bacterium]